MMQFQFLSKSHPRTPLSIFRQSSRFRIRPSTLRRKIHDISSYWTKDRYNAQPTKRLTFKTTSSYRGPIGGNYFKPLFMRLKSLQLCRIATSLKVNKFYKKYTCVCPHSGIYYIYVTSNRTKGRPMHNRQNTSLIHLVLQVHSEVQFVRHRHTGARNYVLIAVCATTWVHQKLLCVEEKKR